MLIYPLEQVLQIKRRRVEEAEKVVKEKIKLLEIEEKKLKEKEAARDKVLHHKQDKLAQLRAEMDSKTATDAQKIQQMKDYLKVVDKKLLEEEKKVEEQKKERDKAQSEVDKAKALLKQRRLEVDKLDTHKKEWIEEAKKEMEIEEGREMDEIGNVIYLSRQRRQ